MNLIIVLPYGIEESGLIVFLSRLAQALINLGVTTKLIYKSDSSRQLRNSGFFGEIDESIDFWLIANIDKYDAILWGGFSQSDSELFSQIQISKILKLQHQKLMLHLWERTGYIQAITNLQCLKELLRSTHGIIALNDDHVSWLRRNSAPEKIVHLLSPGVDTHQHFTPVESEIARKRIRQELGLPTDKVVVLFVGRFTKRKRIDRLAKLWLKDTSLSKKTVLVLLGSGFNHEESVEDSLRRMADNTDNIFIFPFRFDADWVSFYHSADIFVSAGVKEGEPSALIEAMACGLPIVASNVAGHSRLVRDNHTGFLFDVDDFGRCEKTLSRLVDNEFLRKRLGFNARKQVVAKREITLIATKIKNILLTAR